jgi:hypothetical protein
MNRIANGAVALTVAALTPTPAATPTLAIDSSAAGQIKQKQSCAIYGHGRRDLASL